MDKTIIVLEGNSALQKTLFFDTFTPGAVNRAAEMVLSAGGKGANFCRALLVDREAPKGVLLHFSGGENGKKADSFLREEGINVVSIPVEKETRCCTTCLDPHKDSMTELIEPSFPPESSAEKAFLEKLDLLLDDKAPGCAITGSLPDGTVSDLYFQWAEKVLARGKWLFIDAVKGVEKLLTLPGKKILKINKEELAKLTGEEDLLKGMEKLLSGGKLYALGITDGPGKAYLGSEGKIWAFSLPVLPRVVSPLGCGDSVSAFFFSGLLAGDAPEKAFQRALGAGCANCLTPEPAVFAMEEVRHLEKEVTFTLLKEE